MHRLDFASPAIVSKHDFWLKGGRGAAMIWDSRCSEAGLVASKYVIDK